MNIAISGATGYIGKHLSKYLTETGGHRILPLGRTMFREDMSENLVRTLANCDVVINLAGSPINHRWTPEYKKELYSSRVHVTHRIIRALEAAQTKPKLLISASAVGYYPSVESFAASPTVPPAQWDEYSHARGEGLLSELCYAWEQGAQRCPSPTRVVITRFGIVLSPDGGAMQQMLRPLKIAKVAVALGPGTQPFPWIDIRDLCRAMVHIIEHESMEGVYNLVSSQQVSQYEFTRVMAKAYGAWMTVILPRAAFRLLYGEAASFLSTGQCVRPTRLLEAGFSFAVPTVDDVTRDVNNQFI